MTKVLSTKIYFLRKSCQGDTKTRVIPRRIRRKKGKSMSDRKKPYTNQELFNVLCGLVEFPECLQSVMPAINIRSIKQADSLFWNRLEFGRDGNIFLEIGLEYFEPKHEIINLGCFMTPDTSLQAMTDMGKLLANLVYVANDFMQNNWDDLQWEGYRVDVVGDDGEASLLGYYGTIDIARREAYKLLRLQPSLNVRLFDCSKRVESYCRMETLMH